MRKDVTVAVTSLLRTDWYVRQMIRRPIYPYDAAKGPLVYRGRSWPLPKGSPRRSHDRAGGRAPRGDVAAAGAAVQEGRHRGGDSCRRFLQGSDHRTARDQGQLSEPPRSTSHRGPYPRASAWASTSRIRGSSRSCSRRRSSADRRFIEIPGYGFFDLPRTDSLWAMYKAPGALMRRGQWVDRASSDIPLRYIITAALLSDLTKAQGDSAKSAKYLGHGDADGPRGAAGVGAGLHEGRSGGYGRPRAALTRARHSVARAKR